MKNISKITLVLGLALSLTSLTQAGNNFPRVYESNIKIDRIQVNKMKILKQEFRTELNHNHYRDAKYIKYDIIELLEKDIRFQKKKIYDLKSMINENDNPYYRKSQNNQRSTRNNSRRNNNPYYGDNNTNCGTHNINIQEAKQTLRILKSQLREKQDLLHELNYSSFNSPRELRRNLRSLGAVINNMKADIDLYYNTNIDSPYYRRGK